jgi:hypothetical protein
MAAWEHLGTHSHITRDVPNSLRCSQVRLQRASESCVTVIAGPLQALAQKHSPPIDTLYEAQANVVLINGRP